MSNLHRFVQQMESRSRRNKMAAAWIIWACLMLAATSIVSAALYAFWNLAFGPWLGLPEMPLGVAGGAGFVTALLLVRVGVR